VELLSQQKVKSQGTELKESETKYSTLSEDLSRPFIKTELHKELFHQTALLADRFSTRAAEVDETGRLPFENFQELKDAQYTSLTVPKEYGGKEISLYEFLLLQERLSQGDPTTALCIGWHLGLIYDLRERRNWKEPNFEKLCFDVVQNHILINKAASEIATGSPTRGGKPQTTATNNNGKWVLTGRKSFTSMASALDYSLITATLEETGLVGTFLVDHGLSGVSVEENWDMVGMRGTRSDDLVLSDLELPLEALVETHSGNVDNLPSAWLLHIPACYLGVAIAARNYAITFAAEHKPNSLPGPIMDVPEVQRKIGEMELELIKARHVLYSVAQRWDEESGKRPSMGAELAAAKHVAVNSANAVVDLAMRIVGAKSLQTSNPLQRHYRDVRAGLHNPPMDDVVISLLAKRALEAFKLNENQNTGGIK